MKWDENGCVVYYMRERFLIIGGFGAVKLFWPLRDRRWRWIHRYTYEVQIRNRGETIEFQAGEVSDKVD